MSPGRVLVVGLAQCAEGFRAIFPDAEGYRFVDKDWDEWSGLGLRARVRLAARYRTVHYFWGRVPPLEALWLRARGVRVVTHFVGTDVMRLQQSARKAALHRLLVRAGVVTAAVHENLAEGLARRGISARVVPFVGRDLGGEEARPLPERFAALCYVPEGREEFFRLDWILEVAREEPEMEFTVFPHAAASAPANVRFVERIPFEEMPRAIDDHSVLVRLPRHDGLPQTRFEALARGRPVVWTFAGEHTSTVGGAEELRAALRDLRSEGKPELEGRAWVLAEFTLDRIRERYLGLWNEEGD